VVGEHDRLPARDAREDLVLGSAKSTQLIYVAHLAREEQVRLDAAEHAAAAPGAHGDALDRELSRGGRHLDCG
jgi:hypothetical protein